MPDLDWSHCGVNYDTGTAYGGEPTRRDWDPGRVAADMTLIATGLHCDSVCVYGSDADRLSDAADAAADAGLKVWIQPRAIEGDTSESSALLDRAARVAARLRKAGVKTVLNVGCELSIFASGIMPGEDYARRAAKLSTMWWLLPLYHRRLNRMLGELVTVARRRYEGPLTYGAALWERVDWRPFDIVGQNYYRLAYNARNYPARVARFHRYGKPVVITEFGCCAYEGADRLGPSGHEIIDFTVRPPRLRNAPVRSEATQARYIGELLEVYRRTGMAGAFVFEFVAEAHPHTEDPRTDVDMAGYGLVLPHDRTPKQAFHTVAEFYRRGS
ncbi:hypothetical protein LX16_2404 [Stackebrandtia albiflava]|uniref:Abortive infection protein n=1 Tax=Stackebrandtia albiflava TaxID=406432 RepID=A0A562V1K7_9ACTN|nr:hypothetical protein [Stackebrandtia albiflava]TWJ11677.1 hypothetical protein LX16_2404 [Stackebrandtia albiflava]